MSQSGLGRSDFGTNGVAPAGGSDGASLPGRTGGRVPSPDLAGPIGPTRTSGAGADAASGFGDFIVDTTSAEQVALEGRLLAGATPEGGESVSDAEGQTRNAANGQAHGQQPDLAGDGQSRTSRTSSDLSSETGPSPDEAEPNPEAPQELRQDPYPNGNDGNSQRQNTRTFSQEEVSKMQSAWSRQVQDAQRAAEQAQARLNSFNSEAQVEAALRQQERQLAATHGTERARSMVRQPANVNAVKQQQRMAQENALLKLGTMYRANQEESRAKGVVAQQLMQRHGLPESDLATLLGTSSPSAMVQVAKRLASSSRTARVPAETAATQLESGLSVGAGDESEDQRLDRVLNKMGGDWTESELRFMKGKR